MRSLYLVSLAALLIAAAPQSDEKIKQALDVVRAAALAKDGSHARDHFAEYLTLISQSGKLYGKAEALADLGNGFESWENSDVAVRTNRDVAIVTLINTRKRPNMDAARFRVLQVWKRTGKTWRLAAQSSTKMAER